MTSRIFPLYNDNTDHIDLNTIYGCSIGSKAENQYRPYRSQYHLRLQYWF